MQREQLTKAQELFGTANKVTRPEKSLILGFIAGSRGIYITFIKTNVIQFLQLDIVHYLSQ